MSELDDFLTPTLARQLEAEKAMINGDPGPRLAMWSAQDPVTVFGRDRTTIRSEEMTQREDGGWKTFHRHADDPPVEQPPPAEASTT